MTILSRIFRRRPKPYPTILIDGRAWHVGLSGIWCDVNGRAITFKRAVQLDEDDCARRMNRSPAVRKPEVTR